MITYKRLIEVLNYDPTTGLFTWVKATNLHIVVGCAAGCVVGRGYLQIRIDRCNYQAHRLAWLYCYAVWPQHSIDHINGMKLDNRIANLRDVPHAYNMQNQHRAHSQSKTGILGVTANGKGYTANIKVDGVRFGLGTYKTAEEAGAAYQAAKLKLHMRI